MRILVAIKVVADENDVVITQDRTLDFSRAHQVVSEYDLNVLEAAAQYVEQYGGSLKALSVGPKVIDDSKLKKNILARGVDELYMTADDVLKNVDAFATAAALADLLDAGDGYDLIMCGDGSADQYAKQTGVQLAARLDLPYVSGVVSLAKDDGSVLHCQRKTANEIDTLEVPLPAVVSVLPEISIPRICGMKDILAAGKKPANICAANGLYEPTLEVIECKAPEESDRRRIVVDAKEDKAIETFADAIKAALV